MMCIMSMVYIPGIHSKTPIPSVTYRHSDWTAIVKSLMLPAGSTVTTQLINCVVTVLPPIVNNDYTGTACPVTV